VPFKIERLVPGGLGLARQPDGRVVLLRGGLPGESVEASLREAKGRLEGRVTRVLEASPERVDMPQDAPPTMDLGHATYQAQLEFKRGFVEDAMRRLARLEVPVEETRPSPQQWHYRAAAQYLVTRDGVAYRERASHDPRPLRDDPLVTRLISDGLVDLRPLELSPASEVAFRASLHSGEVLVALIGPGGARDYRPAVAHLSSLGVSGIAHAHPAEEGRFREGYRHLWGAESLIDQFGDHLLSVSATAFAQVNPPAAGDLYRRAAELAGSGGRALDLYGGAGALAFHLAGQFTSVTVLEISPEAVGRGRQDAGRLGLTNVDFVRGDASRAATYAADVVTVDPPRAGLSPDTLQALLDSGPARIVYVSCDPATWARDVARLVGGGYRLTHVQPWDFYPQTSHVEVLSVLEK
jgi:23S rRNA (uracil1939-C5)-methyltransferase